MQEKCVSYLSLSRASFEESENGHERDPGVSGPKAARYVLPGELPLGQLHTRGDFIEQSVLDCPHTLDEGYTKAPSAEPFKIPTTAQYMNHEPLMQSAEAVRQYVEENAGAHIHDRIQFCD